MDQTLTEAYILYGHCKFLLQGYDEAQHSYLKAIRISNLQKVQLKDALLHQRLGQILIKRKKWPDAKVFFEMCAVNYETAFSFMNLGIACLYLDEYENAEKLLTKANILDTSNSNVWGYMTLVLLKNGNRVNSAFQSLKESIRLNINNDDLLLDIGHAFVAQSTAHIVASTRFTRPTRRAGRSPPRAASCAQAVHWPHLRRTHRRFAPHSACCASRSPPRVASC
mgnify:CR=1 FL=1